MKIGKFVKANDITIDAVRHYMDLGLIIAEKLGGQYEFDSKCQEDLNAVLSLKNMGFSLSEIKSIFMFKRLGQLSQYEKQEYLKAIFKNKAEELDNQMDILREMKQRVENKLSEQAKIKPQNKSFIGFDFKVIDLLKCIGCGNKLELLEGNIKNNQIVNGKLICPCGEEYLIDNGILTVSKVKNNNEFYFDSNPIKNYINNTNIDYLDKVYRGIDWLNKKLDFKSFENKVVLELGSGMGFFLRSIYNYLPEDTIYVAVDHDINKLIFLKNILETVANKKKILFICCDFMQIPLKDKVVDVLIDISGTSNFSFDHEDFLLKHMEPYLKDNINFVGSYILFKNFVAHSLIEDKYRKNFLLKNIKDELSKLNYKIIEEYISDYVDKGGKYEDYFKDGEKVYSYLLLGKR